MNFRKILCLTAAAVLFLMFTSCMAGNTEQEYVSMKDALKISVYTYDEETDTNSFETLKLNEPKTMMYISGTYNGMETTNFNVHVSYEDGICNIISEEKDIQLSVGKNGGVWRRGEDSLTRSYGYEVQVSREGYFAFNPYGGKRGNMVLGDEEKVRYYEVEGYTGREYYLDVHACDYDGTPVIQAKLKLVQLEDPATLKLGDTKSSGRCSIELVSYEYGDAYKIMEGAME